MKLRVQFDRNEFTRASKVIPSVMQPNSSQGCSRGAANGLSPELLNRTLPSTAAVFTSETNEMRVPMTGVESIGGASSRRSRAHSHSHSHSHGHMRAQGSSSEPEPDSSESDIDSGEPSTSLSELRYLLRWLQKSLPFLVILCAKLVIQHTLGLAVGVGLFMTFLYVNKNIQTQVFLQERHSKLQCLWLLALLTCSTVLLYYTFVTETLYYCLVFLNSAPTSQTLGFWDVLWAVGITNFVIKFIFMGIKCLILLLPVSVLTFRGQGRWLMMAEETGHLYQALAPVPLWFRYLVTCHNADGALGLTLGILLALLYLILKLLGLYAQFVSILKTVKLLLKGEHTGAAATRSQCSEAGDVCPICQGDYREPRALICQHIFCDECIALWFNREKSCPLCRTVITEKVYTWRDGATSPHLQIY